MSLSSLRRVCRETHYLDWRFDRRIPEEDAEGHRRNYGTFFPAQELERHPSLVTGESTPSYLLHRSGHCRLRVG